jgi:GDP-L-fucose synthase
MLGFGQIAFQLSKLDSAPRKWVDSSRLNHLGWRSNACLEQDLQLVYRDYVLRPDVAPC